jgi:hypothetical protein
MASEERDGCRREINTDDRAEVRDRVNDCANQDDADGDGEVPWLKAGSAGATGGELLFHFSDFSAAVRRKTAGCFASTSRVFPRVFQIRELCDKH